MNSSDLTERIEQTLLKVIRPARYAGGELNMIRKDPAKQRVSICLAFPDIYDIGQSYIGFHILYNILNKRPNTLCERTFAPWPDMEAEMRERGLPLWSLENYLPISEFDIVGFTLQYELHYTAVLNMLDLAGIPLHARDRGDDDPFVIGGGTCCSNPEPMADFFDAFLLGDGEEGFPEIAGVIEHCRNEQATRSETLRKLAGVAGVYVPSLYQPHFNEAGRYIGIESLDPVAAFPVHSRVTADLKAEYYPDKPLVPLCEVAHDRLAVEVMRGCTRGCRFCAAGMTYRPRRPRSVKDVIQQSIQGIETTGWDEISLVSLSTTDFPGLETAVSKIGSALRDKRVSISLSSLRADNFSLRMAAATAGGRKTGLTFAPEAGTQRLRDVINKNLTEEQLLETLTSALENGWKSIKLYFMIGLPTETDDDIIGIAKLLNKVGGLMKKYKGKRVNVTISPFSPKPMTPFQWQPQDSIAELTRKIDIIRTETRSRSIQLKTGNLTTSMLECRLARGGRRMGALILEAWKSGSRLDGWSEHFDAGIWDRVFAENGITLELGGGEMDTAVTLPWSHLHFGVDVQYMLAERKRAFETVTTPDCGESCHRCGPYAPLCNALKNEHRPDQEAPSPDKPSPATRTSPELDGAYGRRRKPIKSAAPQVLTGTRFRIRYGKEGPARYTGHLDLVRIFDRTMRRRGIPIAYSQGFHPHPKISFGPPLPLGMKSRAEYVDLTLEKPLPAIGSVLRSGLPEGLELIEMRPIPDKTDSLVQIMRAAEYRVQCTVDDRLAEAINDVLHREEIIVIRRSKRGDREKDIRPGIRNITIADDRSGFSMMLSLDDDISAKPAEVLAMLFDQIPEDVTRTEQYIETGDNPASPFDITW